MKVLSFPPVALLACVAVSACGPDPRGGDASDGEAPVGDDASPWAGARLPEPLPRPDFVLTDLDGEPYDFRAETRGKVALLFFGYTHCPDICPVHMANLAAVLRDVPMELTRHVEVVFVTTDPQRDTPERMREWLGGFHPSFVGLRGTTEEVNAIERGLGLPPSLVEVGERGDTLVGHAAQVLAFGADGPARLAYPWGVRQRDWLRDLPRLVRTTVPDVDEPPAARPAGAASADPGEG